MAKRIYMAGVATVDMFDGDKLFATAKTLTESSINISTSAEDIRGGEGAALLGKYYHTSAFDLTLTDALFNMEYLAKSVGVTDFEGISTIMVDNEFHTVGSDKNITLLKTAETFTNCVNTYAYVKKIYDATTEKAVADAEYVTYPVNTDNKIAKISDGTTAETFVTGDKFCIKYFTNTAAAKSFKVRSDFIPATFHLVLKVNLYAAGQSDGNKTQVGYLLVDIPRFQLDGSQDLSMSMTGASTTSLKGSALATEGCTNDSCDSKNYYATLTEVMNEANWYDGLKFLAVENGDISAKQNVAFDPLEYIYAVFEGSAPKKLANIGDELYYTITVDEGLTLSGSQLTGTSTGTGSFTLTIYAESAKTTEVAKVAGVDVNISAG